MLIVNRLNEGDDTNRCNVKRPEYGIIKIAKVEVAGSNPVSRSKEFKGLADTAKPFFLISVAFASVFASVW